MVVSNIFYVHPYLGKIPILTNIFEMGWNHQLVVCVCVSLIFFEEILCNTPEVRGTRRWQGRDVAPWLSFTSGAVGKSGTSLMVGRHPARLTSLRLVVYLPLFYRVWTTSQVVGLGICEPSRIPFRELTYITYPTLGKKESHHLQKSPWWGETLVIRTLVIIAIDQGNGHLAKFFHKISSLFKD